jgi:hypothetical protein
MKLRIAIWAGVGFLIAAGWAVYAFANPGSIISAEPVVWTLVRLSCPIVFASVYFHFGVSLYWCLVANAATYALVGLVLETLRQQLHPAHSSN